MTKNTTENSKNSVSKTYSYEELFTETNDGTGDVILTFPPEMVEELGLTEGMELNLGVENGNLIVSKKQQ